MADGFIVRRGTYEVPEIPLETGLIVMFYGLSSTIPQGYTLCNGANGTPDLRNRFVVGSGGIYSIGNTGGSANAVVVSHSHGSSTGAAGNNHSHYTDSGPVADSGWAGQARGTASASGTVTTNSQGAHSHTGNYSFGTTGVSATNANLPPYYGLFYIIKEEE